MKKIPIGAEAANILVGEVDFLTYPMVALVRLLHSFVMPDLTEVPVPTKFVFILLGPTGNQSKYHEIGRAIAVLLSDEVNWPLNINLSQWPDFTFKKSLRSNLKVGQNLKKKFDHMIYMYRYAKILKVI